MNQKRRFLLLLVLTCFLRTDSRAGEGDGILVITSDAAVKKYSMAEAEFRSAIKTLKEPIHLQGKDTDEGDVAAAIKKEDPSLIYCVGSRAYQLASQHAGKRPVIFSSALNWRRLPLRKMAFGIANEPHPGMQLTLYRYFFPKIKTIGVLYSEGYNKEWAKTARKEAEKAGYRLELKPITRPDQLKKSLSNLLSRVDALWLIPDPIVLSGSESVAEIFQQATDAQKAVFAYDESFVDFNPVLMVGVDPATVGRQAASLANDLLSGAKIQEQVQQPAGTSVVLNLRKVRELQLEFNPQALDSVQRVVQ